MSTVDRNEAVPESIGYRTLVFTDMESSSAAWNESGDAFEPVRKRHTALLRDLAQQCQGEVVDFMGDGAFVVFAHAVQAVQFAIATQKAVLQEPWSALCADVAQVKVRIGLHTGRVILTSNPHGSTNYSGPPVNLAARISDAAHGGQILVCDTARREICASQGKRLSDFKDCGQHQVKDFDEGIWLWQPLADGLPRDFDPIIRKPAPLHPQPSPRVLSVSQPHTVGDYMVGRDDLLGTLHKAFQSDERQTWQQALIGEVGIGKRTVAEEYARRYGEWYEDVFWLSGASESTLHQHLKRLAESRKLYVEDVNNDMHYIDAAQRRIGNLRDAIVVVHNLAFPLQLKEAFPHGLGGRLLVTTTNPDFLWPDILQAHHEMTPLDLTDSARYLRLKSGRDATDSEAEALADTLRGRPGSLEQAAVALQLDKTLSWTGHTETLQHRNLDFAQRYETLKGLLRLSVFLADEPIPVEFAQNYCKPRGVDWKQTLQHLDQRALIRWDRMTAEYTLTPSIRAMERETIKDASLPSLAQAACKVMERTFPTPNHTNWPHCERLILHAQACARHVEEYGLKGKEMGLLMYRAYLYLSQRHRYREAMPIQQHVEDRLQELQLTEADLDRLTAEALDSPELATARTLNQTGISYFKQGRFFEAEPIFKQALAIRQRILPEDHPNIALSLNNLASLYERQGNYGAALPLLERALAIRVKVLGEEHQDTAIILNNLAGLYQSQGNYIAALPLYERGLTIREKVLGEEHPNTAQSLDNLAGIYQSQGNYSVALPLLERALEIYKGLGAEHPDTAICLNNLANLYNDQGNYATALPMYERALTIREKVLGEEHPDTAQSLNNLAVLYDRQGDYAAALPLFERAQTILEKMLGDEHPRTKSARESYRRVRQAAVNSPVE